MTTCCTDSSIDMILPMYSSLLAQLTAQPRISWRRRPNSHLLLRSPLYSHKQMSITCNNRKLPIYMASLKNKGWLLKYIVCYTVLKYYYLYWWMNSLSNSHTYSTDIWHLEILYMDSQNLKIQKYTSHKLPKPIFQTN